MRFWGVRGSIPTPLTPEELRRKVSAVVERITAKDLASNTAKERFLAGLPPAIFGTIGGNTTCVEIRLEDNNVILFDAGTGIFRFGLHTAKADKSVKEYHIFFTHFHWDHIQGLPFFGQLFDPTCTIHFYSMRDDMEEILRRQMQMPYFPITMDVMAADIRFHTLDAQAVDIGSGRVSWRRMKHPGHSHSYKIEERGRSVIFSTDTELVEEDFARTQANSDYFRDVDVIVLDSQYTLDEAIEKYDWGHSSYSLAVDFAAEWNISRLVLFHHEPQYNDNKMYNIAKSAQWYKSHLSKEYPEIHLAREGLEMEI
jgi:phosphoribosyl 1,2-cyclic phosphodiesterase